MIQSNFALRNWHRSRMDYLILDSKTWNFQIGIILIHIQLFEQLTNDFMLALLFLGFPLKIDTVIVWPMELNYLRRRVGAIWMMRALEERISGTVQYCSHMSVSLKITANEFARDI